MKKSALCISSSEWTEGDANHNRFSALFIICYQEWLQMNETLLSFYRADDSTTP
jgi:hypothetical protein